MCGAHPRDMTVGDPPVCTFLRAMLGKQAILNSLNKLSDNHTRQKAWEELTRYAERQDATSLPEFLKCLHNTTAQYTIACRKGAVRMYGHLAGLHSSLLPTYLPRIAETIVLRLKDKDGTRELREACAAAFGALVEKLEKESTLPQLFRPLLPLLVEPNEALQNGAAACLSAILTSAGALGEVLTHRVAA